MLTANRIRVAKLGRQDRREHKAAPRYEICAGCGTYHELRRHAKVWVQMRHAPCSRGLGR